MLASGKIGCAGAEGVDFQVNMMLLVLLRAYRRHGDKFTVNSELEIAGKFDDLFLTIKGERGDDEHVSLLQAKQKLIETKTITFSNLLIDDEKKMNLKVYFNSFKEIIRREQFKDKIKNLFLFTNLDLCRSLDAFVEPVELEKSKPIFFLEKQKGNGTLPKWYKFKDTLAEEFEKCELRDLGRLYWNTV